MTRYTNDHEWARETETAGVWRVGISNYAQEQLGDVVMVELPEVGTRTEAGDSCAVIESVKAASEIYSPFAGEIVAVNGSLGDSPELVNDSPEADGWLFDIKVSEEPDLSGLMEPEEYAAKVAD